MPLVSSGGGVSQVKDTGHNGMESIGICLSVLTLSIFLVREIRTDKHPHHSPPPHAHTLQSPVTQDSTPAYQRDRAQGRGEGDQGASQHSGVVAFGPAPTPLLRRLTPKNCRNWAGGGGLGGKMRCVSRARGQPTSRVRPSPTSIQRRLLLRGRGTAMRIGHHPRAGDLAGKEGGGPGGSRALPPLPQLGGGRGRTARCGNPAAPDLKGDGCVRPLATHLASVAHLPRVCGAGDRYAGHPA